jgi:GTP-binding protein Era
MAHKAGFVNIIGNPNVGKSTLMNALVGERLSIITSKAQTTRHRIMGIVNGEDFQIVYSDTPGMLKPSYKLQEKMMKFVDTAMVDADVVLFVSDINDPNEIPENYFNQLKNLSIPILHIINKLDTSKQEVLEEKIAFWKNLLPNSEIIPASALKKFNTSYIFDRIVAVLPEGEAYYEKDQLTDKSERFFVSEIIREKILIYYDKEVPYSVEIIVEDFKEKPEITVIRAVILVSRESQKPIIIGDGGKAIKKLGTEARKDIEKFLEKKVYLDLNVKVDPDWRDNELRLKRMGYTE